MSTNLNTQEAQKIVILIKKNGVICKYPSKKYPLTDNSLYNKSFVYVKQNTIV